MSGNFKFLYINMGAKKTQKINDITAINIGPGKEKKAKPKKNNVKKINKGFLYLKSISLSSNIPIKHIIKAKELK